MSDKNPQPADDAASAPAERAAAPDAPAKGRQEPRQRLDPTRYGDWEKNGRCIDF